VASRPFAQVDVFSEVPFLGNPVAVDDPVTGSLNAALAGWLTATGRATLPYVARQGTALGRAGRVLLRGDGDGDGAGAVWTGGGTVTCIAGRVAL